MDIYYYHRETNGSEVAAVYSSWEEADKDAEAYLEEHGYAIANIDLKIPLWEAWMYIGEDILAVPPQYFVDDELVLEKAEAYGYNALAELIKRNIELENE